MNSMSAIVMRDVDQGICKVGNNICKGGTVPLTPGDDHLSCQGGVKEIERYLPFLLGIGIDLTNDLKFGEGLFIVKGVLFKAPWILGSISLVEHHLVVKHLNICTPHIVIAFEEVIPCLHTILLELMSLDDCLHHLALVDLLQGTI